jgi:YD repeat-containing protein
MSITTIIKKVADIRLSKVGFERIKIKDSAIWFYERQIGDTKQTMYFQKSNFCKGIRLVLGAGILGATLSELFNINDFSFFLSNLFRISSKDFFEYTDDIELESIITALTDAVIEKAVPIFDVIVSPFIYPTPNMYQELCYNTQLYAESFIDKYHITYERDVSKIKECIIGVEDIIYINRKKDIAELNELFLTGAAYLGELIIRAYGGTWGWKHDNFCVIDINDNKSYEGEPLCNKIEWNPLCNLFFYWCKPELYKYTIISNYKSLLHELIIEDYYDSAEQLEKRRKSFGGVQSDISQRKRPFYSSISTESFGEGLVIEYRYDDVGNLVEQEDWNGITSFEHDSSGRIIAIVDQKGVRKLYEY